MATTSEAVDLPGNFKVWVGPCPKNLDPLAVHAMSSKGLTLFSIPRADGRLCSILSWNDATGPAFLNESDDQIAQRIAEDFPSFGAPTLETVAQLRHQRTSRATTVRAKEYHDVVSRSLLLGDAAHSTGGTLGQGANSALTDAVVLDELLKATPGRSVVEDVGQEFSKLRQPEGLALWKLLQLPPKGLWSLPYLASQGLSGLRSFRLFGFALGNFAQANALGHGTQWPSGHWDAIGTNWAHSSHGATHGLHTSISFGTRWRLWFLAIPTRL
eukprot:symbB.v1.2.017050.t1/scaffold1314.1/size125707/3